MVYCIKLISEKEIKEKDVRSIIIKLPEYLRGRLDFIKEQEWGWPCICNVHKPVKNELMLSGSNAVSSKRIQDFTSYIQHALDELGYDISIAYTDGVLFDEEVSKDDKKIKLNPEININIPKVNIPEVKLKDDYINAAAKIAENLKDFNEKATNSFKHMAETMSDIGAKSADLIRNGTLKDSCSHCGADMKEANTKYCERCYQLLIMENAELQLKIKKRIPEENVTLFMSKLRELIIKPQTNKYNANDKLKDIADLYLKYIDKLGGIKYESND